MTALSTASDDVQVSKLAERQAITYPTTLTHVTEANSLITRVSNTGPQSWLKTLTEYVDRQPRAQFDTDRPVASTTVTTGPPLAPRPPRGCTTRP